MQEPGPKRRRAAGPQHTQQLAMMEEDKVEELIVGKRLRSRRVPVKAGHEDDEEWSKDEEEGESSASSDSDSNNNGTESDSGSGDSSGSG